MNFYFALSAKSDTGFFEDVWNYLYDVYLRVDGNYQNLGFEKMPLLSVRLTLLGIVVGAILACIAMAYHKQVLGAAVRTIIEKGALSPESALTAEELGYKKNPLIKNALARSTSLYSVICCVGREEYDAEQRSEREAYEQKRTENKKLPKFKSREYVIDTDIDRFYIPEDKRIRAEVKFEKKGSGWISTIISVVAILVIFFVILLVLPQVLSFLDKLLG